MSHRTKRKAKIEKKCFKAEMEPGLRVDTRGQRKAPKNSRDVLTRPFE